MNAFGQIRAVPWRTKRPTAIANRLGRRAKDVAENLLSEEATETGRKYRVLGSDGHDVRRAAACYLSRRHTDANSRRVQEYVVEVAPTPSCSCPDKELPCKVRSILQCLLEVVLTYSSTLQHLVSREDF